MLLRQVRLVPVGGVGAPTAPVDVRVVDGMVSAVAPSLAPDRAEEAVACGGRFAIPGLWDKHVHLAQWAAVRQRLDTSGARGPEEVLARLGAHLEQHADDPVVVGVGHRTALWSRRPSVAELDAVCGARPVVLVSGDGHSGWLSTAAYRLLGVAPGSELLEEADWFPLYGRLAELAPAGGTAYADAVAAASRAGVVGVVDLEFGSDFLRWPERVAGGVTGLRVRSATYPEGLPLVAELGLRSGDPLTDGHDLVVMGPLKVISDGSLNTRTALCCQPYADAPRGGTGRANYDPAEMADLLSQAAALGLDATVHALGDAALGVALAAFGSTGDWGGRPSGAARGSIEHAQLVTWEDLDTMAGLGLTASVQPAHLLDDRDVSDRCWADRTERCFAFRAMLDRGIPLALGSDAPVSALDPWLAMAAAVHRSADEREPWHQEQAIGAAEALTASTDGQSTLAQGSRGDIVLLDADPLAQQSDSAGTAAHLRHMGVEATLVAGRLSHRGF